MCVYAVIARFVVELLHAFPLTMGTSLFSQFFFVALNSYTVLLCMLLMSIFCRYFKEYSPCIYIEWSKTVRHQVLS